MGLYVAFDGCSGTGKGAIVEWMRKHATGRGKRVIVVEDRRVDFLRDLGARFVPWCAANGVDRGTFLLPLFAAGSCLSDAKVLPLLGEYDVVLRDRSWITSLGYTPASGVFSAEQVWDLYVTYGGVRIPDAAVIIDAGVETAMAREAMRKKHRDIGLDGKMSGDRANRERIRENFLAVPRLFGDRMRVVVVSNDGAYTEDESVLQARLEQVGREILGALASWGVVL